MCKKLLFCFLSNKLTKKIKFFEKIISGFYDYRETWERKNIVFHDNGTISFNQQKIYIFDAERSVGSEEDVVVVPNIPMLVRFN